MPPSPADLIAPIEQALATLPADSNEYAALASLLDQMRQGRIRKSRVRRLLRFTPRATPTSPQRRSLSIRRQAMPTAHAPGGILRSGETGARACQCCAALVSRSGDAGGAAVVAADRGAA